MDSLVSDNLYMTNLPCEVNENMIAEVFSKYGRVVQCKVLPNPITGGMGAALVRFASVTEAQSIVMQMNGTTPPGFNQPVNIKFATPKGSRGGKGGGGDGGGGGGGGGGFEPPPSDNLYVKGLPSGIDEPWLKEALGGLAAVVSVKVLPNPTPDGTCAALARFATVDDATHVKNMLHGQSPEWCTQRLLVRFANSGGQRPSGGSGGGGGWDGSGGGGWGADGSPSSSFGAALAGGPLGDGMLAMLGLDTSGMLGGSPGEGFGGGGFSDAGGGGGFGGGGFADAGGGAGGGFGGAGGGFGGGGFGGGGGGFDDAGGTGSAVEQLLQQQQMGQMKIDADFLVKMVNDAVVLPGAGDRYHSSDATIHVGGLPGDTVEDHVYQLFSPLGAIFSVAVKTVGMGRNNSAIAFVKFVDPLSAQAAIAVYNGMQVPDGSVLKVKIKDADGEPAPKKSRWEQPSMGNLY